MTALVIYININTYINIANKESKFVWQLNFKFVCVCVTSNLDIEHKDS